MEDRPSGGGQEGPGSRLRYCPLEPGELVSWEQCTRCSHRPEDGFALCAVTRRRSAPRSRGFWDQESPPS